MNAAILDTDTLSEFLKRRDPIVLHNARLYFAQHGQLAFCAVTRYEIRRGYLSRNAVARLQRFDYFCQNSIVFPISDDVLDQAALLWADARVRGLPENDADLIVASTALVHGRSLATGNAAHFNWIPGLIIEDWRVTGTP